MIVKCEQCQTRFKIPDDKVTEKGVKVRCTKCQHTFRVTRDGQGAGAVTAQAQAFAPPGTAAPAPDPFAQFGQAARVSNDEATRPGMMRPDLAAAARGPAVPEPFVDDAPTRVGPLPKNLAMMRPPKGPLGLGAPANGSAPAGPENDPFGFASLGTSPLAPTRPEPAAAPELTRPGAPAWGGANPFGGSSAADPFASFGAPESAPNAVTATQPAMVAAPPLSPSEPLGWGQPQHAHAAPPAPAGWSPPDGQSAATWTGPMPTTQKNPAFAPQAPPAAPETTAPGGVWDFASSAPQSAAPASSPFDFSPTAMRDDRAPPTWQTNPGSAAPAAPAWQANTAAPDPAVPTWQTTPGTLSPLAQTLPEMPAAPPLPADDPFALPGGSMAAAGPFNDGAFNAGSAPVFPAEPAPSFDAQGFGDGAFTSGGSHEANAGFESDGSASSGAASFDSSGPADASALFGAPGASLSGDGDELPPAPRGEGPSQPMARLALQKKTSEEVQSALKAAAAEAGLPPQAAPEVDDTRAAGSFEPPPPRGSVLGLVANIGLAAVLVVALLAGGTVYLNEGKLDRSAFTWSRFQEYLSARRDLVAVDISNGLYETRGGRPVFFVRGEVHNRSGKDARVSVRAEIFDGEQMVRFAQGFAGATPSPEDLNAISAAADVETLNARLQAAVKPVATGKTATFLVPFYEYPADLKDVRVKVLVSAAEAPAQAAAR